ncbi:ATP-dependent DNA helicase Rep [Allopseudospirillum japonicum]|uniref:ATP-dependent DNA helicase Rep n=1 Tax=Allopseudospirillum japonicum TaxID=64971 RepID=A0A1H6QVV5_9GAMM|nr:DNA helicase Rep [Allopseudospirillum japonicum]SEI47821.1 ATP-dependent DNA helicase Rep [Allopseudospirillum japonicum]
MQINQAEIRHKLLYSLNDKQRQAVCLIDRPLLVLAGAGSGKTSVITRKIAWLIQGCGLPARYITAVTFTNKAAREMKERVANLVQGREARGLTISTFHSLGLDIIRKEVQALGYKAGFSLFDAEDAKTLVRDLLHTHAEADSEKVNWIYQCISQWKNDLISPEQAQTQALDKESLHAAQVYALYQRHLKAYNAVDFDDLIALPVILFEKNPQVLARWQASIHYLLVDEYQDTNTSQYRLVRLLVGERQRFTVVGDDDQSIYAWRGARPENLLHLGEDFPNLSVIKLEQNYRSTRRILKAANTLIANNPHIYEKKLWSDMGVGDPIQVWCCDNEEVEAERVANEILLQKMKGISRYKDFAVLYRSNHQARLLEIKLQSFQIPYKISGGTSFFSRNEVRDIMAYLRLMINPDDDNAFLRIINIPRREIGPATLEKLATYATQRGISLLTAIDELGLEQILKESALQRLRRFKHWFMKVIENSERADAIEAVREMVQDLDYEAWLHQNASAPKVAERRLANVWTLVDSLQQTLTRLQEDQPEAGLTEAIARLVLRDILEQQEAEDESDKVHLLTLHAAKGLEFPHVFMLGVEEDILPHRNSLETNALEEERRLMYVGITRARQCLTLTLANERKAYGEKIDTSPSRFLDELPADDLQWEGRQGEVKDPEVSFQRGLDQLEMLKSLLKG